MQLLRGRTETRASSARASTATPTFGVLKEHSEEWLLRLLRRCVTAGWATSRAASGPWCS